MYVSPSRSQQAHQASEFLPRVHLLYSVSLDLVGGKVVCLFFPPGDNKLRVGSSVLVSAAELQGIYPSHASFYLHVAFLSSSWEGTIHKCDVPSAMGQGSQLGPGGITLLYFVLIMGL